MGRASGSFFWRPDLFSTGFGFSVKLPDKFSGTKNNEKPFFATFKTCSKGRHQPQCRFTVGFFIHGRHVRIFGQTFDWIFGQILTKVFGQGFGDRSYSFTAPVAQRNTVYSATRKEKCSFTVLLGRGKWWKSMSWISHVHHSTWVVYLNRFQTILGASFWGVWGHPEIAYGTPNQAHKPSAYLTIVKHIDKSYKPISNY